MHQTHVSGILRQGWEFCLGKRMWGTNHKSFLWVFLFEFCFHNIYRNFVEVGLVHHLTQFLKKPEFRVEALAAIPLACCDCIFVWIDGFKQRLEITKNKQCKKPQVMKWTRFERKKENKENLLQNFDNKWSI